MINIKFYQHKYINIVKCDQAEMQWQLWLYKPSSFYNSCFFSITTEFKNNFKKALEL
jgi:hypothetical protein